MNKPIRFDASNESIAVEHGFSVRAIPLQRDPPERVEGAIFGIADMAENSPHAGERHPDGDEILYLISGRVRVVLLESDEDDIDMSPGDGLLVPKGIWHRVDILEPSRIVYLTPGPNGEHRPLP
jgi:quercetin dioxygenase-like cupin family protein